MSGPVQTPVPRNEPIYQYQPGSEERSDLKAALSEQASSRIYIPLIIGGKEVRNTDVRTVVMPHNHGHVLANWNAGGGKEVADAITAAAKAHREWSAWPWEDRAAVFLRAAELLAGSWRATLNAATMLGQSKTAHQAEIDSACELIDFFRFNVHYAERIYGEQPLSVGDAWNRIEYRPLEGFVFAVTPFNFTSIGGNLPTAPVMLGNTVVWKPSRTAVLSSYYIMKLLEAAGLPPGVINFVPGKSPEIADAALNHEDLAGIHFTGSTAVFHGMWETVGRNIGHYNSYPRLVGETGGKNFIIAHQSADVDALRTAIVRGGFEYQGQKCSAASRVYVPQSVWTNLRDSLIDEASEIKMGDIADFGNFMGAVIDKAAFEKISAYIEQANKSNETEVLVGGEVNCEIGFFIRPTVIQAKAPHCASMCEEIFGPVVTIYVYKDDEWSSALDLVDGTSPYALTGTIFAQDRQAVQEATSRLRYAAGNFYVNDKPTGAVVGQQPFGGSRASGTNDKAGSMLNLLRWVSARTIKENLSPPRSYTYPFMNAE
ncbi:MAG: L-glutamate gamma-semialdehyde dehydrogenase [Gemmatimonadales bacterium]